METEQLLRLLSDNVDWAQLVVVLREQFLDYTQREFADELAVDVSTVAKWEQCKNEPRRISKRRLRELAEKSGYREDLWPRKGKRQL